MIKNISYLTIIQISNSLIPLLIIPYISNIIGFKNFGDLEHARIFVYYFTIIINYGFDLTITRDISLNRHDKNMINKIVCQTFYVKFILFIICSLFFGIIVSVNDILNEISGLLFLTFIINFGYVFYPIWFFQGIEKMDKISIVNVILKLILAILTIVFIKDTADYWVYNFLQSLAMIFMALYGMYYLIKYFDFYFQKPDINYMKKILKDGFPIFIGSMLVTIITSFYFLFLKFYSTEVELSIFSTSNKLIAAIQLIILLPFSQAFFPLINRMLHSDKEKYIRFINIASIVIFIITFIQGLIVYFYTEFFIKLLFGSEFVIAVQSTKILAFLPMFASLTNIFAYQGLLSLKKDKLFLQIHIIMMVLCISLNIICINNYDSIISSFIRIILEILMFIISFVFFRINIKKL